MIVLCGCGSDVVSHKSPPVILPDDSKMPHSQQSVGQQDIAYQGLTLQG